MTTPMNRALFDRIREEGRTVIDEWVDEKLQESVRLEFKSKRDPNVSGLDAHDRSELARAICGLANTSGGLVGFGFRTNHLKEGEPDQLTQLQPIADVKRCAGRIAAEIHEWHDPAVRGLDLVEIQIEAGKGVIVINVPASDGGPHRVSGSNMEVGTNGHYFIRTVSSTVLMPHAMLSALFGRRPEPVVRVIGNLGPDAFILSVRNDGRGTAAQLAVAVSLSDDFEWRPATYPDWVIRGSPPRYLFLRETLPLFPQMEDRFAYGTRRGPGNYVAQVVHNPGHADAYVVRATVFTDGRPRSYEGKVTNTGTDIELAEVGESGDD